MDSNDLNEALWNHGIFLSVSVRAFAPQNLRKKFEEADKISALEEGKKKVEELENSDADLPTAFVTFLSAVNEVIGPRDKLRAEMQTLVMGWLQRGDLVGFGYEKPRQMASRVHEIPAQLWHGNLNWIESSLSAQGLELVQIRVLHSTKKEQLTKEFGLRTDALVEGNIDAKIPQVEAAETGRPTIRGFIEDSFEALLADGLIEVQKPAKAHYPLVRSWLMRNKPEANATETTPSNEGIRRHFSPLFNDLKKNHKQ